MASWSRLGAEAAGPSSTSGILTGKGIIGTGAPATIAIEPRDIAGVSTMDGNGRGAEAAASEVEPPLEPDRAIAAAGFTGEDGTPPVYTGSGSEKRLATAMPKMKGCAPIFLSP